MGFILDGLDSEAYDRRYSDRVLLARILSYFRPHTRAMVLVGAMLALNSLAGVGGPILISRALDLVGQDNSTEMLVLLALGVLLLGAAAWGFNFVRRWFSARRRPGSQRWRRR
jgi:ABC-type bacteriocin/lantibiotic exporter with double-glycine peptidase domain